MDFLEAELKLLITCGCSKPFVLRNAAKFWPLIENPLGHLSALTKSKEIINHLHVGKKQWLEESKVMFETKRKFVKTSIIDYINWLEDKNTNNSDLLSIDCENEWTYLSYVYGHDILDEKNDLFVKNSIMWSDLGFDNISANDSSFWLGSKFSYTPLHMDTYGSNLVAQLCGSKRWILFPSSSSQFLYPTRIPYEESSIYSEINPSSPDLIKHPLFQKAKPYQVDLQSGDILYVPPNWWHFVVNLNSPISFSVNTWIPIKTDKESRIKEALVKYIIMKYLSMDYFQFKNEWLNPNEDILSMGKCLQLINVSLQMNGIHTKIVTHDLMNRLLLSAQNKQQIFIDSTDNNSTICKNHEIIFNGKYREIEFVSPGNINELIKDCVNKTTEDFILCEREKFYETVRMLTIPSFIDKFYEIVIKNC